MLIVTKFGGIVHAMLIIKVIKFDCLNRGGVFESLKTLAS